jgi:hypothetical protein
MFLLLSITIFREYQYFKTLSALLYSFHYNQLIHKYTVYHNIFSLHNVHSYMFRHLFVIFRELQKLVFTKLHKFFKLKLLKLQFHKIITLKLFGHRWGIQYSVCDITIPCESKVFVAACTIPCYCYLLMLPRKYCDI